MAELPADLEALIERLVDERVEARLEALTSRVEQTHSRIEALEKAVPGDQVTIMVFSGEYDKLMTAFIIATGAIAMGLDASLYFTFWGLDALRSGRNLTHKDLPEKLIAAVMPSGSRRTPTSRLNLMGVGARLLRAQMDRKNVASVPELIELAQEMGVKLVACRMAMDVMGVEDDDLIEGVEHGGIATYLGDAIESRITLLI